MLEALMHSLGSAAPVIDAEVASIAALRKCAAAGMGCALLPEIAVAEAAMRGEVAAVPVDGAAARTEITMTWLRRAEDRPSATAFLETTRSVFGDLVPGQVA